MELYNWLNNKSSKSGYIKDVLKLAMENELNKKDQNIKKKPIQLRIDLR